MSTKYRVAFHWLPVWGRTYHGPLGVSMDFIQNAFDLVFLLVFIGFWKWGPFLVVLYYMIETVVMTVFTGLKIWKSNVGLFLPPQAGPLPFKLIFLLVLGLVVSFFSYGQLTLAHDMLQQVSDVPSLREIVYGDSEFMLGVAAIVLQQLIEYLKYSKSVQHSEVEFGMLTFTPLIRIFIQQVSVIIGVAAVFASSFLQATWAAVLLAVILGMVKLIFGQLVYTIQRR